MQAIQNIKWHTNIRTHAWRRKHKESTKFAIDIVSFGDNDLLSLQKYTNDYIRKKVHLDPHQRDQLLIALISSSKYMIHAFLSCVHLLSRETARKYLGEIRLHGCNGEKEKTINYLGIIQFVYKQNPTVISDDEAAMAQAMSTLLEFDGSYELHFPSITVLLRRGVDQELFTSVALQTLPDQIWNKARERLDSAKGSPGSWSKLYSEIGWLKKLHDYDERDIDLTKVDTFFPTWRAWAIWSPNPRRLLRLHQVYGNGHEASVISKSGIQTSNLDNNKALQNLFALLGPDFKCSKHQTLLDHLTEGIKHNTILVQNGSLYLHDSNSRQTPQEILDRALDLFEIASQISLEAFQLFCSALTKESIPPADVFNVLEAVFRVKDVKPDQLQLIRRLYNAYSKSAKANHALRLLPVLDQPNMGDVQPHIVQYLGDVFKKRSEEYFMDLGQAFDSQLTLPMTLITEMRKLRHEITKHTWLEKQMSCSDWDLMKDLPAQDRLEALFDINQWLSKMPKSDNPIIHDILQQYYNSKLLSKYVLITDELSYMDDLISFWIKQITVSRRRLALRSAEWKCLNISQKKILLQSIDVLGDDDCETLLAVTARRTGMACVNFARVLASNKMAEDALKVWREILYDEIFRQALTIINWTASYLSISQWVRWLNDVRINFGQSSNRQPSALFNDTLYDWAKHLDIIPPVHLNRLNHILEPGPGLKRILLSVGHRDGIVSLLHHLALSGNPELKGFYNMLFETVPLTQQNISSLRLVIKILSNVEEPIIGIVKRLAQLYRDSSPAAFAGIVASLLHNRPIWSNKPEPTSADLDLMRPLLEYFVTSNAALSIALSQATDHLDKEYDDILQRLARLQAIRTALTLHDSTKTEVLIEILGIEDEDCLLEIPEHLVDVIEQISHVEYEICFPLDHLKPLQKIALNVGEANNLVVRLSLEHGLEQPFFCVHLDPEPRRSASYYPISEISTTHTYWQSDTVPDHYHCYARPNLTTSHVFRILRRHLQNGFNSIEDLYKEVSTALKNIGKLCYACGSVFDVNIYRSTFCSEAACQSFQIDPALLLSNFNTETYDLLLFGINNCSIMKRLDLIPNNPMLIPTDLTAVLANLPKLTNIIGGSDPQIFFNNLQLKERKLISYLSTLPSFICPATGALKIPSMPKIKQFVVASSSPPIESARIKHFAVQTVSQVVFHGTSADRLFPILQEGLKVCSGTSLQRIGASLGSGVYCSTEPSTALSYATAGSGWAHSAYGGMKVLLGCELAGTHKFASSNIYVLPDPTVITVRYVFLFPAGATAPIARHVAPAMQSAFSLIRSGLA